MSRRRPATVRIVDDDGGTGIWHDNDDEPVQRKKPKTRIVDLTRPDVAKKVVDGLEEAEKGNWKSVLATRQDLSPPRRSAYLSPPRRRVTDTSPPRRRNDVSQRQNEDLSPPRKKRDLSPPRRGGDLSPPRRRDTEKSKLQQNVAIERMSSGASAGLQSASKVATDIARQQKEERERLRNLDPSQSGRHAKTIVRDARGRKIDVVEERRKQAEEERKKELALLEEYEWGRGSVQKNKEKEQQDQLEAMKAAPFSRYKDDETINRELRDKVRWDDPLRHLVSTKKTSNKEGSAKVNEKLVYRGPAPPPNRFGISPGYRWDGVVRTNGFEARWFKAQARQSVRSKEAYDWSVEDM